MSSQFSVTTYTLYQYTCYLLSTVQNIFSQDILFQSLHKCSWMQFGLLRTQILLSFIIFTLTIQNVGAQVRHGTVWIQPCVLCLLTVFLLSLDTWAQVLAQLLLQFTELSVPVGHINLAEGAHSYVATATADVTDIRIRQRVIQSISLKNKSRVEPIPAQTG